MFARRARIVWHLQARRLIAAVTLLAHLAGTIGLPAPAASARTSCGQAASACCCGTAEQCRSSGCGCPHSPALVPVESEMPACCSKKANKPAEPSCCATLPPKSAVKKVRWIPGIAAQKCRGGTLADPGQAAPLWIVAPFEFQQYWPLCDLVPISQESPLTI